MFSIFKDFTNLVAVISSKNDGPMGLSYQVENEEKVRKTREIFLNRYKIKLDQLVTGSLIHGNNVAVVQAQHAGTVIPNTDGLLTNTKNLFLSVTVADCLPIFMFDRQNEVVALVHAGWRGVAKKIPVITLEKMQKEYRSSLSSILVGIGPHICAEHYEVQLDVADHFSSYSKGVVIERDGLHFLNLSAAVKQQLLRQGINETNIEISTDCTFERSREYFSYRRDKPKNLETMIAVMGVRK